MLQCAPQKHRQDTRESVLAKTAGWLWSAKGLGRGESISTLGDYGGATSETPVCYSASVSGQCSDCRSIVQNPLYIYFQNSICAGIVDGLAQNLGRRME